MRLIIISIAIASLSFSCKSNQTQVNEQAQTVERKTADRQDRANRGERRARPTVEEVFQMDANNDGQLSAAEVADSPMSRNFSTIDANSDGLISKEEFENAPKPQKGQRKNKG